jgi:hypothetical protein
MSKRLYKSLVTLFCFSLLLFNTVNAAELSDHLSFIHQLIGKAWLGHYDNPDDAHLNHHQRWEPILEGQAVRATKRVPEVNFTKETVYYWDPSQEAVRFLSLTSKGQVSTGSVSDENGRIVLIGSRIEASGGKEFKFSFEVLQDGTLEDRFYLKANGEWMQGHLIRYASDAEAK